MDFIFNNPGLFQGLTLWSITACTATICYRKATR